MRQVYLITYDVSHPKRLRRIFKLLGRFGDHLQLSVFRCELDARAHARLSAELLAELDPDEDQALVVALGPAEGRGSDAIQGLGRGYKIPERTVLVV